MILEALAALAVSQQVPTTPPAMVSGADVVRYCRSQAQDDATRCFAYIAGIHDAAIAIYPAVNRDPAYCLPDDLTVGRLAGEVAEVLADNSWLWSEQSALSVIYAFTELYPCMTVEAPKS